MQIVIDIPKENYEEIIQFGMFGSHLDPIYRGILNAVVLPEHGRLVDADKIKLTHEHYQNWDLHAVLDEAPTVLEGTKDGTVY